MTSFPSNSGARGASRSPAPALAVAADASLASFQAATVIPASTSFSWDFNNQCLQPYDAATATYNITTLTWSSTNGGQVAVVMAAAVPALLMD